MSSPAATRSRTARRSNISERHPPAHRAEPRRCLPGRRAQCRGASAGHALVPAHGGSGNRGEEAGAPGQGRLGRGTRRHHRHVPVPRHGRHRSAGPLTGDAMAQVLTRARAHFQGLGWALPRTTTEAGPPCAPGRQCRGRERGAARADGGRGASCGDDHTRIAPPRCHPARRGADPGLTYVTPGVISSARLAESPGCMADCPSCSVEC